MNNLFDQIKILKSNRHYRLGDLIFCSGYRWEYDRGIILNDNKYQNSFLRTYLESNQCGQEIDAQSLVWAISKHSQNIKTNNKTLYINIRLGDSVMEATGKLRDEKAYGKLLGLFIFYPENLIKQIHLQLQQYPEITEIQFVTALHFGDNDRQNWWKFSEQAVQDNRRRLEPVFEFIKDRFQRPISILPSSDNQIAHIDNDFLTLCNANHIIIDKSNFGELILKVRDLIQNEKK